MDEQQDRSLQERVERLEAIVAELQSMLKQTHEASRQKDLIVSAERRMAFLEEELKRKNEVLAESVKAEETSFPPKAPVRDQAGGPSSTVKLPPVRSQPSRKSFGLSENMRNSEYWLNKVGIGLLLLGVVFLFKYSIDQGWITPAIRIGFGLALAIGLLFIGLRIYSKRRYFSQVLLGGAIATFYITGFSAFQLYALVSYPVAFALMVSVTLLAFILSLKQNEAVLSLIGAIGGLGTPFLLYTDASSLPALVGYTCLVLTGTSAIYFYRGWRSLLWTSVIGGWTVFLVGLIKGLPNDPQEAVGDRWAIQLGIAFGWLAFWALPLIRDIVWAENPTRWPRPSFDFGERSISQHARDVLDRHVHLLSVSTPLIALAMSMPIWSLSNETWGWITMGGAMVYGLVSWNLKSRDAFKSLAYTHALEGVLLLTIAFRLLLEGDTLLFTLATEGTVLHLIARRLSDKGIAISAHIIFAAVGLWLSRRLLLNQVEGASILNAQALTDLWVIGVALVISKLYKSLAERRIYLLAAHAALAGLLVRELDGNLLFFLLAGEAIVLCLIARRLSDQGVVVASHIFFAMLGLWLGGRLFLTQVEGASILNAQALTDLWVIGAALGVTKLFKLPEEQNIYRLAAHVAILGWFLRELSALPNGQGYVTIAWGIYAVTLLVLGLRLNRSQLRTVAVGTLLIVVGKLFLVDLTELKAIWRILLFLGFGGLFLVLSYYFQALWKRGSEPADKSDR